MRTVWSNEFICEFEYNAKNVSVYDVCMRKENKPLLLTTKYKCYSFIKEKNLNLEILYNPIKGGGSRVETGNKVTSFKF